MGPTWDMPPKEEVLTRSFGRLKPSAELMTELGDAFSVRSDILEFLARHPNLDPATIIEITPNSIRVKGE